MAALAWAGWARVSPRGLFHAATYTVNYQPNSAWFTGHTGHLWSLSVEEQFLSALAFCLCPGEAVAENLDFRGGVGRRATCPSWGVVSARSLIENTRRIFVLSPFTLQSRA
jgi:peptidoglycan/LPS O-acetylase OafA/YrhL